MIFIKILFSYIQKLMGNACSCFIIITLLHCKLKNKLQFKTGYSKYFNTNSKTIIRFLENVIFKKYTNSNLSSLVRKSTTNSYGISRKWNFRSQSQHCSENRRNLLRLFIFKRNIWLLCSAN